MTEWDIHLLKMLVLQFENSFQVLDSVFDKFISVFVEFDRCEEILYF